MSLPAKREPGGGATARQQRGGGSALPPKRAGWPAEQQQQLSALPPNSETECVQPQADWSALSLHGLQEVTVRSLGASDLRRLTLALLTQWQRDVEIWTATLSDLRGVSRSQRTEAAEASIAAETEATEAERAIRVAEDAGALPELVQRLREDAEQTRRAASEAHKFAAQTARLAPLQPRCQTMYIEDFGEEEISVERALVMLDDGTIQPGTLVYSADAEFPFEGWAPWSECSHCFAAAPPGRRSSGGNALVSTSFYYSLDGEQPSDELPVDELPKLVDRGVISENTLIFSDDPCFGSAAWVAWSECCSRFGLGDAADAIAAGRRDGSNSKRWRARIHAERQRGDAAAQSLAEVDRLATVAASAAAAQTLLSQETLSQIEEELLNAKSALSMAEATARLPENLMTQLRQDVVAKEAAAVAVRSLVAGQAEALQEAEAAADFAASAAVATAARTKHDGSPRLRGRSRTVDGHSAGEGLRERNGYDVTDAVRLATTLISSACSNSTALYRIARN